MLFERIAADADNDVQDGAVSRTGVVAFCRNEKARATLKDVGPHSPRTRKTRHRLAAENNLRTKASKHRATPTQKTQGKARKQRTATHLEKSAGCRVGPHRKTKSVKKVQSPVPWGARRHPRPAPGQGRTLPAATLIMIISLERTQKLHRESVHQ
jgi:hypothetical protein